MAAHLRADLTFEAAKAIKGALEDDMRRAAAVVGEIQARAPLGPMGLTAEHIRVSPEYREAKAQFDVAFSRLRDFNGAFVKRFRDELRDERRNRRA